MVDLGVGGENTPWLSYSTLAIEAAHWITTVPDDHGYDFHDSTLKHHNRPWI